MDNNVEYILMVGYKTLHTTGETAWRCRECLDAGEYDFVMLMGHLRGEHGYTEELLELDDGCIWYQSTLSEILAQNSEEVTLRAASKLPPVGTREEL